MVLEHALLPVRPGTAAGFDAARAVIAACPGSRRLSLSRCVDRPDTYLLLVEWDRLEDHTEGFRGSGGYQRWREVPHGSHDPLPTVEHFREVLTATAGG